MILFLLCSRAYTQITEVPILDFKSLQPYLEKDNDTVYVVNFWATWCKPCVAELPFLEQLNKEELGIPMQVILVSLDFTNQIESRLIPFINDHALLSKILVLDDPDANAWIDLVDESWTGAIPATLIYKQQRRLFFNGGFEDFQSIKSAINQVL